MKIEINNNIYYLLNKIIAFLIELLIQKKKSILKCSITNL